MPTVCKKRWISWRIRVSPNLRIVGVVCGLLWAVIPMARADQDYLRSLNGRIDNPGFEEDYEKKPWAEVAAQLPPAPQEKSMVELDLGPTARNRFFVDAASLSVGADRVVRYVAIILSPSGAKNVSFEGLRCDTYERRYYAFGREDGSWSKARGNEWRRLRTDTVNGYAQTLAKEFFCPDGIAIQKAEEGVAALKAGGKK